jgi:putative nucleotidyltransferase with HDIG domain
LSQRKTMQTAGDLPNRLRQLIIDKLGANKLPLPAMPAVAMRCLELLRSDQVRQRDLVREIERDPVASAQLLRLANSAAFGGVACSTVTQAVTRVGFKPLKALFVQLAAREVFRSKDRQIAEHFRQIWEHSIGVALLARDVAALGGTVDQGVAYQAGLLHDIGKPVLGILLLELEKSQRCDKRREWLSAATWLQIVNATHRDVAVALARKWNLAAEVQRSVADCGDYDAAERYSVGNIVRFANAMTKQAGLYAGAVDAAETETLVMVGRSIVDVGGDVAQRLASNIRERVKQEFG